MKLTLALDLLAFQGKFAIWLSKSITASLDFLKSFDISLQIQIELSFFLLWFSPRALLLLTISQLIKLLLINRNILVLLGLDVYTLVQIADIFLKKLNKLATILLIQICWHGLGEMILNGSHSALSFFLGQGLVHFVLGQVQLAINLLDLSVVP